tara:strand:+ start:15785 stop:16195 length:411 start_codon:yes stop_codon:yes gene_type:complete
MLHLSTEERWTLVCTADPDIKVKKRTPHRLVPINDVVVNGGVPLQFVVRTLNSREQMRVASVIASSPNSVDSMLAAVDLAVMEVKGVDESTGKKFHETEEDKVLAVLDRVPSSILSLLGLWVTEKSWGTDPLVGKK